MTLKRVFVRQPKKRVSKISAFTVYFIPPRHEWLMAVQMHSLSTRILGHSSIQMTKRYTLATDTALRRAVENLDSNSDFGNGLVTRNRLRSIGPP